MENGQRKDINDVIQMSRKSDSGTLLAVGLVSMRHPKNVGAWLPPLPPPPAALLPIPLQPVRRLKSALRKKVSVIAAFGIQRILR